MSQSQQFLRAQNDLKKMGMYVSKKSNGQTRDLLKRQRSHGGEV